MPHYHPEQTPASTALADLIRAVLRMSAHSQRIGTHLMRELGLTNARWQTLGELSAAPERLTVSQLARLMGLTRQAVQRLADEMAADGLVMFLDNPRDGRAMHVVLTDAGRATYDASLEQAWQWSNAIAEEFDVADLAHAVALVEAITRKMDEPA